MKKLGEKIVKLRIPILILATILLIPAMIGYKATRVNYDMLVYLPQDIDTMKGQDILKAEFGTGAFAPLEVDGMTDKQVADLKAKIWYDTVLNLSVPKEILPQDIYDAFNKGDATLMFIIFDDGTSEDGTVEAVKQIRKICSTQCFLGGMTPGLVDTQELSDREAPIYIGISSSCSPSATLSSTTWAPTCSWARSPTSQSPSLQSCSWALRWTTRSFSGTAMSTT